MTDDASSGGSERDARAAAASALADATQAAAAPYAGLRGHLAALRLWRTALALLAARRAAPELDSADGGATDADEAAGEVDAADAVDAAGEIDAADDDAAIAEGSSAPAEKLP